MRVGILGFPSSAPNMAGLLSAMAHLGERTEVNHGGRGVRYVYENKIEGEEYAKVYTTDSPANRIDFAHLIKHHFVNFSEADLLAFTKNVETGNFFMEYL